MTVLELSKTEGFTPLCLADPEREITGCYIGDLLSWVMGRAEADSAWITIMSNNNVIAVATLADTAAVILAEGVTLDSATEELALSKGVNVLTTSYPAYEAAKKLMENGI